MSHRPVCAKCNKEMFVARNGVIVLYYDGNGDPYEAYAADMYACPECHANPVMGFGQNPIWTSYGGEDAEFHLKKMEGEAKKHDLPFVHVR